MNGTQIILRICETALIIRFENLLWLSGCENVWNVRETGLREVQNRVRVSRNGLRHEHKHRILRTANEFDLCINKL